MLKAEKGTYNWKIVLKDEKDIKNWRSIMKYSKSCKSEEEWERTLKVEKVLKI